MKPKVTTMKEEQWRRGWPQKQRDPANITQEPPGVAIRHRDSAIQRVSLTEGCDRDSGEAAGKAEGQYGASQVSGWQL